MPDYNTIQNNRLTVIKILDHIKTDIAYSGLTDCEYQAINNLQHFINIRRRLAEMEHEKGVN